MRPLKLSLSTVLPGTHSPAHLLLAHPKLQQLLSVGEREALLWDLRANLPAARAVELDPRGGIPCCVAYSPNGSKWAVGDDEGIVQLYDGSLGRYEEVKSFATTVPPQELPRSEPT